MNLREETIDRLATIEHQYVTGRFDLGHYRRVLSYVLRDVERVPHLADVRVAIESVLDME